MPTPIPLTVTGWRCVLGHDAHAAYCAAREASVPRSDMYPDCYASEPLCDWQCRAHADGWRVAKIEKSMLGYSLRHGSGLDGFGLIASVRSGELDGTLEHAMQRAQEWIDENPRRRAVIQYRD